MSDGKIVIETDLDSSGLEGGLKKLGSITTKGLKTATTAIAGTAAALGGISTAAVQVGTDFEAQMSRVKAISGATGEEFEELKKQAIQLGADTAFSAYEAAQGMENLAAAGFTTSEIMEAMPGMLNLAAASGEDLAKSADIAASTLRGFGLEASDAAHVADVLAENANRTNSSVAETGEAMKYVAPLARAAGISMEETAAAIGIMANAGIQGSQAGTTLRGAISRLSKPTEDMQATMEELGISFYDSEGKMKSLSDQVGMMRKAMSGMTDEQKNNYLVTLYGQEALSGMLALINEGEGELSSLTEAYKACDGSAEAAAETMQDNLKGAIEQLSGSAESLGIVFYEDVSDSLEDTVKVVNKSVDNITDAFENGGLDKAIEAAGDEFADLATAAAEHAPDMVDTAVDFIESFAGGVVKNKGRILNAAGDMAETLAGGLADLLPKEVQKPVEQAIDAISDSFKGGGLEEAGETVVDTFDNLIDVVGDLAEVALPPLTGALDLAGDNLDLIAGAAAAAFTAFKGYKVITETTSVLNQGVKVWKTASAAVDAYNVIQMACTAQGVVSNATLTAGQAAVGLLTGRVSLATAAQTAWNTVMSANPIGLVVAAVGALAAGLGVYVLTQRDATDTSYELSEAQQEVLDSCNEVTKSMNDGRAAREENVQSIDREYDKYSALVSELQSITDANGQVKAGYQDRAKVITGELASALGTEIELTDGVIQNYQETINKIKEVIVQKKAEALLSSMQEEMAAAYDKTTESLNAYKEASDVLSEAKKNVKTATQEADAAEQRYMSSLSTGGPTVEQFAQEWAEAKDRLDEAKKSQEDAQAAVDSAKTSLNSFSAEVNNYNALVDAMATGETAKIEAAMTSLVTSYKSYTSEALAESEKTRQEMYNQASSYAENMKLVQDGTVQVADSVYQDMARAAADSITEFNKVPGGVSAAIQEIGPEVSGAMISALAQADIDGKLDAESQEAVNSFINGFNGLDKKTQEKWAQAWFGALEGLDGFEKLKDPAEDGVDAFLKSLQDALEVHSPSRAVKKIFAQAWPGANEGLEEGKEGLLEKGKTVINNFLEAIGGEGISQKFQDIGVKVMNFFGIGVDSKKKDIDKKSKEIAESSNELLGSEDTEKTGSEKSQEYHDGIESNKKKIDKTSKNIADSSNKLLGSANTEGTGSRKSKEYDTGVGSNKGKIDKTSKNIADSSNTLLGSADTQGTGSRKSKEYDTGVGSNKGKIDKTSRNIADSSNTLLGSADTQGTGSRKSSEYNSGVGSNKGNIDNTSWNIADSSNNWLGSADTWGTGSRKSSEYDYGVASNKNGIDNTSRYIADSSNDWLGAADTGGTGWRKGNEYDNGLAGNGSSINSTACWLSDTANAGMGVADTWGTGSNQGGQFASGVGSQAENARAEGESLSSSADSGARAYDGYGAGSGFGSGFVSGIGDWIGSAVDAAADLAASALQAAKDFLGIHSPSREMRAVGNYYGQGFSEGMEDEEKQVQKSSTRLAQIALDSMDLSSVVPRMREAMAFNTGRIAKTFSTEANLYNQQEINRTMHLSEEDIILMAKIFGAIAGDKFADNMGDMKIEVGKREFGRMVREVSK